MMARVSMQAALAKAMGASMRRVVSASILCVSLSLLFAQQGTSGGIGAVTRLPNGPSYSASLISVQGVPYVVFVSDATNLLPNTSPGTVYVQNLQTGQLSKLPLPRGFGAHITKSCERADGSGFFVAALGDYGTTPYIFLWNSTTGGVREYSLPGIVDIAVTNRGDVYLLQGPNFSDRVPSWKLYRLPVSGPPETLAGDAIDLPSHLHLTASDDGKQVLVSYTDRERSPKVYVRVEYPTGESTWSAASAYLPAVDVGGSLQWIVDADGGFALAPDGVFYRIEVERRDSGGANIRLVPVDEYPVLADPAIQRIDMRAGQVAYARVDYAAQQVQLRLLDLSARQDIPIGGWYDLVMDGTILPRRIIKGGLILFVDKDRVIPKDTNGYNDVFVYNLSRMQALGVTIGNQPRRGLSQNLAIGADASLVAFTSDSPDLVSGKTTPHQDVFVSLNNQLMRLMGVGGAEPDGSSFDVSVSRSGRPIVAFASYASNLVAGDMNNAADVFLWSGGNDYTWISAGLIGGDSYAPAVAPDGVYFLSTATNQIPPDTGVPQAYKWASGALRVIRAPGGSYFDSVESVVVSPNGRWVVLTAHASVNAPASIYLYDNALNFIATLDVSGDVYASDVSNDGKVVLFTKARLTAEDNDDLRDVYVWDFESNTLRLVSRNPVGSKGNGDSFGGTIDANGRRVVFISQADNLVPVDLNGEEDVFVYDLVQDTLYCVTRDTMGLPVGGSQARLAANGGVVAFATGRPELVWMPYAEGVFIALHQIGCVPNGDVNLDGVVDDADLLAALFAFGQEIRSLADLNVDGVVDDADLLIILFNFGTGCRFGAADGNGDSHEGTAPSPRLERLTSGKAILYYFEPPRYVHFWDEAMQRADIDQAVAGRWPYPIAGGLHNAWKHEFGDPSGWNDAEVQAFRQLVDGAGYGGDFVPAWGNPFNWTSPPITYQYQPRADTYVRFRPKLTFAANACQQFLRGEVEGILDLKFFGHGRDEIAKFFAHAGMTPGWLGYKAEAWVMGSKVWEDGWYRQQSPWSDSKNYSIANRRLFTATYSFTLLGLPCLAYIAVDGYAQAALSYNINLSPSSAEATFTPAAGLNAVAAGGVGGTIAGISLFVGAWISFNPFLQLSLPATVSVRTENRPDGGCDLVASANVRLTLRALAGELRVGLFTSCLGGPVCKSCNPGEQHDIAGFLPAYCCSDECGRIWRWVFRKREVRAALRVASWSGLNYNLATVFNQTWRWRIK